MEPWEMRDSINEGLHRQGMAARVCGAEYTKRGQIAITPGADTTISQVMEVVPRVLGEILRRGEGGDIAKVAVETDTRWRRYVITGIPITAAVLARWQDKTKVEDLGMIVRKEIEKGYPSLSNKLRMVRTMKRDMEIMRGAWSKSMAVLVAVEGDKEEMEKGASMYLFGKGCRISTYRPQGTGGGKKKVQEARQ
jgi:hypothetical protein